MSADQDLLHRAGAGFASLAVSPETRRAALTWLEQWLGDASHAADLPQLHALAERGAWGELLDGFWRVLPFGTGGRRGRVGLGPNRFNPWTLGSSVAGHAHWLRRRHPSEALRVVIAYDVRVFLDQEGVYDPARPCPVRGWTSRDFAELAARTYAAAGVRVWLQPRGDARYLATPELSFAVRHLGAHAGLMISASHNPPDDNGAKVYDSLGGQTVPPDDEAMARAVAEVGPVSVCSWEEAREWIDPLGPEVREAYLEHVLACAGGQARGARVCFTGLHGVGAQTAGEALRRAGHAVEIFALQAAPDGRFPTVPGGVANPERPQVLERAQQAASARGLDLVLGTDPDADRVGCSVRHRGGWRALTGDEIALILVDHVLSRWQGPRPPLLIQTEVTSMLVARVARAMGAEVVDHLPVGFKYIGAELHRREEAGEDLARFALGVEESHGVLASAWLRDKDAAGGALLLAEASSLARARGETLVDRLHALWARWGASATALDALVLRGAEGRARIEAIQARLRASPPARLAGRRVLAFHDRQDPRGPLGPLRSATDRASRDMLVFHLEGDARVVVRPSGTEPKTKIYLEVIHPSHREAVAGVEALREATRSLLQG